MKKLLILAAFAALVAAANSTENVSDCPAKDAEGIAKGTEGIAKGAEVPCKSVPAKADNAGAAGLWRPDSVLPGFEMRQVSQPADYAGAERSTIIRRLCPDSVGTRRAVLYIHGYNDYFFQGAEADSFVTHGYDFYAVDLRRYGRSWLPGQRRFDVRSLNEYFPDIDSALVAIGREGIDNVVLMGHSTGGLIASYFLAKNERPQVKALVLNSPFLDWNLGRLESVVPLIAAWGRWFPNTKIKQGKSEAYAESLLADRHGLWQYRTDWKLPQSPPVTAGWIRAIDQAQKYLRKHPGCIHVPTLLMYSQRSVSGDEWTEEHNRADAVLDVADIRRYGERLAPRVTCFIVDGGLHDLFLSSPSVTTPLYSHLFNWLSRNDPATD